VPIYEYECQKCGRKFEYMQSMSEAPKKKCEKCGGKLEKLVSAAGFVLKGGGWYKDLYASSKPGASGESSASESSSSSASDKSESKPDQPAKKAKKKSSKGK
jgi:putative FmdB family regulatory protein